MMQFISKPQPNAPVISLPTVATPTFSPVAGSYPATQSVTISCSTPASNIFYTTDGTVPTTSSIHYTTPVSVSVSETLNAIATAVGFLQSAVGTAVYSIAVPQTATPTFAPVAGTYIGTQSVAISCTTPSSSIYFTTDGTVPTFPITGTTTLYTGSISVVATETLKAIGAASGFTNSSVASAAYVINAPVAATPTFSPVAGTYASTQTVTLSCSTPSSSIYFTIDGSTPTFPITGTTTLYSGPLTVSASETIKAIGVASGFSNSVVGNAAYTIGALSFDFFISPNGDDATGDGSLGNPWSITALNTKQSTYRSKKVGIIGDIAGVQTHIQQGSVNGAKTTLFSVLNGAGSLSAIVINGGVSGTPTYVGSCTSSGVYRAQWAVIDASQPGTGTLPSSDNASLIGQQQGSALAPANFGWLTIDGLVVKNSCYAGIIIGSQSEATIIPGIIIQNCEVGPQVCQSSDENPGGILLGVCNGAQILNCFIHDCTNTSSFPIVGTGGITTFRTLGLIVTNCTIVRNGYCIQNKDNNQWGTYSYNYFDVGQMGSYSGQLDASIIKSCEPASGQTLTIHHNICVGAGLYWGAGASGGNNISGAVDIHNNTLYTPTQEGWATWYNCNAGAGPFNFYNNVLNYHTYGFAGNGTNAFFVGLVNTGIAGALIDYNYFGTGMNWQIVATKYASLAAWQSAVSQDAHSISTATSPFAGTPTFELASSFSVTGAALTGSNTGGIMGALDGTGSIGCTLAVN